MKLHPMAERFLIGGVMLAFGWIGHCAYERDPDYTRKWCEELLAPDAGPARDGAVPGDAGAPVPSDAAAELDGALPSIDGAPPAPGTWACEPGTGTDYLVAEGSSFTLDTVPWTTLAPGDTVRIAWRPEPYRRRILLSTKGTEAAPIKLCGVPGPAGQRPVLEGIGSMPVASGGWLKDSHSWLGIVVLFSSTATGEFPPNRPAWIVIEGLELRNAHPDHGFPEGAAGVRINTGGDDVLVRSNVIHGNANGIFSSSDGPGEQLSERLRVIGNEIYGNGGAVTNRSHQVYTQGTETLFERNYIHDPRPGSNAVTIKDRSPGTIVRYNWLDGSTVILDLVEPQEHHAAVRDHPAYDTASVVGNVIIARDLWRAIHFGHDTSPIERARRGPLQIWHNQVEFRAVSKPYFGMTFLDLDHPQGVAYANNNATSLAGDITWLLWIDRAGTLQLGGRTTALAGRHMEKKGADWPSSVAGLQTIQDVTSSGWAAGTYLPVPGGVLDGAAGALSAAMPAPTAQYRMHQQTEARPAATTLGAFEVTP